MIKTQNKENHKLVFWLYMSTHSKKKILLRRYNRNQMKNVVLRLQRFERGWPGLIYRAQFLMLGMTEDWVVRMMKMDILCSVARPASLVMNNKVLFIFSIYGSMWWNLTLTFPRLFFMIGYMQVSGKSGYFFFFRAAFSFWSGGLHYTDITLLQKGCRGYKAIT